MAALVLATNWWAFVIRGLLAILFGLLVFLMPGIALWGLVLLFGIYSVADGIFNIFNIAAAFNARPSSGAARPRRCSHDCAVQ